MLMTNLPCIRSRADEELPLTGMMVFLKPTRRPARLGASGALEGGMWGRERRNASPAYSLLYSKRSISTVALAVWRASFRPTPSRNVVRGGRLCTSYLFVYPWRHVPNVSLRARPRATIDHAGYRLRHSELASDGPNEAKRDLSSAQSGCCG